VNFIMGVSRRGEVYSYGIQNVRSSTGGYIPSNRATYLGYILLNIHTLSDGITVTYRGLSHYLIRISGGSDPAGFVSNYPEPDPVEKNASGTPLMSEGGGRHVAISEGSRSA
jgi:hypothetical protein